MVSFRVTRDSDLDLEEDDSVDLMKEVEESLRKRKRGAAVRLEIFKTNNNRIKRFLEENLDVTEMEVYEINGPLDPTCFFKFIGMKGMWPWLYEPFVPQRPLELPDDSDLFAAIRENDILLHHPYESFDPVVKLVSDAADDPRRWRCADQGYEAGCRQPSPGPRFVPGARWLYAVRLRPRRGYSEAADPWCSHDRAPEAAALQAV